MKKLHLSILWGLFFCAFMKAQFRIQNFQLSIVNATVGSSSYPSVLVEFQITQGPSCSGYVIYHSADSVNFYPVNTYAGICGDPQNDQQISFIHSSPVYNANNFYKAELTALETGPVKKIFVGEAAVKGGVLAFPNPSQPGTPVTLRFFNIPSDREFYGRIVHNSGLRSSEFFGKSSGMLLSFSTAGFREGVYGVWITDGNEVYQTKIIVKE